VNKTEEETIRKAAAELLDQLKARGLKIAFAESITGGLISGSLARIPGASSVLLGSVVTYTEDLKHKLLGVPQKFIQEFGAESEEVTRAMSKGLFQLIPETDVVLAITGAASASVNEYQISSPVGRVYVCFGTAGRLISREASFEGSRQDVLNKAVIFAFEALLDYFEENK
jgi:PncC family amidohydrolase